MWTSVLFGALLSTAASSQSEHAGAISVTISALRSDVGKVVVLLFDQPKGFPSRPERAIFRQMSTIRDGAVRIRFDGVAPGTYAISVFHDENGNGKLDTNFIGIPKEGVGASNNAKGRMGPPKFTDAKFPVEGTEAVQTIEMQYVL